MEAHSVTGSAARRVLSSVRGLGLKDPVNEKKVVEAETPVSVKAVTKMV